MFDKKLVIGPIVIVVDALGNLGIEPTKDEPFFILVATTTEHLVDFNSISEKYRKEWNKDELKAGELKRSRRKTMLNDIAILNPGVQAVFIDKNADDNPPWWNEPENRKRPHYRTLSELMDKIFSQTNEDGFFTIVDKHQDLEEGVGEEIIRASAERNNKIFVNCNLSDSEKGDHKNTIQTNDFIPRELFDRMRDNKPNSNIIIIHERLKGKL